MSFVCQSCRTRVRTERPFLTSTGREVCGACSDTLLGAAAGVAAGGGITGAISTAGWFGRVRAALGKKPGGR